jgi:hypothetical protein
MKEYEVRVEAGRGWGKARKASRRRDVRRDGMVSFIRLMKRDQFFSWDNRLKGRRGQGSG